MPKSAVHSNAQLLCDGMIYYAHYTTKRIWFSIVF